MQAYELELTNLYWDTESVLKQLAAVITSATELKCFELQLNADFERVRVLLDLARDLAGKVEESVRLWGQASENLEFQERSTSPDVALPGDMVLQLLQRLVAYLQPGGDPQPVADCGTAILASVNADKSIMNLIAFVVEVLRKRGDDAAIMRFPSGAHVVLTEPAGNSEGKG